MLKGIPGGLDYSSDSCFVGRCVFLSVLLPEGAFEILFLDIRHGMKTSPNPNVRSMGPNMRT